MSLHVGDLLRQAQEAFQAQPYALTLLAFSLLLAVSFGLNGKCITVPKGNPLLSLLPRSVWGVYYARNAQSIIDDAYVKVRQAPQLTQLPC